MNKPMSKEKREAKDEAMVAVAQRLFFSEGIDEVKMTDIAYEAGIGVATVYRAFKVKKALVIRVGANLWSGVAEKFAKVLAENEAKGLSGIQSMKILLGLYEQIFLTDGRFFMFLKEFDSFCLKEKIDPEELVPYEKEILKIHAIFMKVGEKGKEDGTIRDDCDFTTAYFAYSKALIGLCQKLIAENNILPSDQSQGAIKQISIMLEIAVRYFEKR
jgi:AcrR family transcriptional regulator